MFHTSETIIRPQWGRILAAMVVLGGLGVVACAGEAFLSSLGSEKHPSTVGFADTGPQPVAPPPAVLEDLTVHCRRAPPPSLNEMLHRVAAESNLNPRVLALTVYRESKCRANAKGSVGEIGLGQIYPAIWKDTLKEEGLIDSVDDLYDPEVNLRVTAFVLNEAYKTSRGKPVDALRIYNGRGRRAVRYAAQQRDRYHALWGEEVFFRPRPLEAVRPSVTEQPDL